MSYGYRYGYGLGGRRVGAPGFARPQFAQTPLFLYQPQTETGVTLSGGAVTAVTGINSPNLTAPTTGPLELTDGLGRKFWRFRGSNFLEIAPADLTVTPRALTVVAVMRNAFTARYFGISYLTDGVTVDNYNRAFFSSLSTASSAPMLATSGSLATSATGGITYGIVGAQLQVAGVACNGSRTRYMLNEWSGNGTITDNINTNMKGARIGGYLKANGTDNIFDLYAIAGFAGTLTDAQVDAITAKLVADYQVPPSVRQIVFDGDSITASSSLDQSLNMAMLLSAPGANFIPSGTRVISMALGGSQTPNLLTRRDAANGWPLTVLPGGSANNILAFQIGVNDRTLRTSAEAVANIESYLAAATTGVFARGWNARLGINIASANGVVEAYLEELRVAWRGSTFLANIGANAGGANEGRFGLIDLEQASVSGVRPFEAPVTASFYLGDGLHPSTTGASLMVTGGDTPANGWQSIL